MKKYQKHLFVYTLIFSFDNFFISFGSETFISKLKTLSYIIRLVENYYVDEIDLNKNN